MRIHSDRFFFGLAGLEGIVVLAWLVATPVAASHAVLAGLSRSRLALAGVVCLAALAFLSFALWPGGATGWRARLARSIANGLETGPWLVPALVSFGIAGFLGAAAALWSASLSPAGLASLYERLGPNFSIVNSLIRQSIPLVVWGSLLAFQAFGALALAYSAQLRDRRSWQWRGIGTTLLVWLTGLITLFHWLALIFGLTAFTAIPGWHWKLAAKPVTPRHLLFLGLWVILLLVLRWLIKGRPTAWRSLLVLALLGYSIQVGMGVADGKGLGSLREKYYNSLHRSYTNKAASRDEGVVESIRRYEEIYSNMLFPSTKPPGVMTVYIGLERAVNSITHKTGQAERTEQLASVITILFPVLSLGVVFLIYAYVRRFAWPSGVENGLAARLAPLFFLLAPNIVLLPLLLDQALYPALFLAAGIPVLVAFQRQSFAWAAVAGICLYGTIFFSFSLLPVFALPVFYAAAQYWSRSTRAGLLKHAALLAALAGGVALAYLVLRVALNYDFFTRYANAMSVVYNYDFYSRVGQNPGDPVSLALRARQILEAAYLNVLEFASMVSFPVFLLFAVRGGKAILAVLRRAANPGDTVQCALFLCFLALNAIGQMRGEAGRLWMYWVPVVSILAAVEIAPLVRRRPWLGYALVSAQWVTLLLTYQFQDLIF